MKKTSSDKEAFVMVEEMPQFLGGSEAMSKWISSNIKYPPPGEVKQGITGQVIVNFMVTRNGKIKDVKVIQPVNPMLDAEALRVISGMPTGSRKPGRQTGRCLMKVPINFNLK